MSIHEINNITAPSMMRTSANITQRGAFSFPGLKTSEIIQCLHELGINITEDEIKYPEKNKDQCQRIFESLIETCSGISKDELNQPAFCGLSVLNFPELHEDSIPQLNALRAAQKLMDLCGIKDFTSKDFMSPSSKRFKRQLSGIINFAKFREERLMLLTDLTAQRDVLLEELNRGRSKCAEKSQTLEECKKRVSDQNPEIMAIESECKDVEIKISELNNHQAEIREKSSILKSSSNVLKEQLQSVVIQMEDLKATQRKIASQIISSPEKFHKQIHEVAQSLKQEQNEIALLDKKLRELNNWINATDSAITLSHTAHESVLTLKAEADRYKANEKDLAITRADESVRTERLTESRSQLHQIQRQCARVEDKLQQLRKQQSNRASETKLSLESLHMQLKEAEELKSAARLTAEATEAEALSIERETAARRLELEKERGDMTATYRRLEKQAVAHLQHLRAHLDQQRLCVGNCA